MNFDSIDMLIHAYSRSSGHHLIVGHFTSWQGSRKLTSSQSSLVRYDDWVMEKKAALIEAAISIRVDRSINSSTCKKKLKGGPALAERFDTVSYSC